MLVVLLAIVFIVIWLIPSGPPCPACKSHLTKSFKAACIRDDTNEKVIVTMWGCYMCEKRWDYKENGRELTREEIISRRYR